MTALKLAAATLLLQSLAVANPQWATGDSTIPADAVLGGAENGVPLYICHAPHIDAIHPGKALAGHCNIEFNGGELEKDTFEILVADSATVHWVPDSLGGKPADAYPTGDEKGKEMFSCRAELFSEDSLAVDLGLHPGKLLGPACNIPYGGGRYEMSHYSVMVIDISTSTKRIYSKGPEKGLRATRFRGRALDGRRPRPR